MLKSAALSALMFCAGVVQIMCFAALSVVSLVTAVVSIQLLRLAVFHKTVDGGETLERGPSDAVFVVALVTTACECALCIVSAFISCRLAGAAKDELQRKRDGTFHVDEDEKDVMVVVRRERDAMVRREEMDV